jgi:hypothetical protein
MDYDVIFKNTLRLLKYRGYTDVPDYHEIIDTIRQVLKKDRRYGFIVKHGDITISVVFDTNEALGRTASYTSSSIGKALKVKANTYILICQSKITKDAAKTIKDMSTENNTKIELIPYTYLRYNFPKRIPICKYKILPKDKIDEVVEQQRLSSKLDMSIVYQKDNAVIWLGAVPGDVIIETTHTEKSIKEKKYLLVKMKQY